jgi:hypothetical protein
VYYNRPIRIKSNHSLSQASGTVGVHPAISMSLLYNSCTSPSVVSKSSSVTWATDQTSLSSPPSSSSSVSSSSPASFSTILPRLVPSCLDRLSSSSRVLPSQPHSLRHFVAHQAQHSDSVGTLIRFLFLLGRCGSRRILHPSSCPYSRPSLSLFLVWGSP